MTAKEKSLENLQPVETSEEAKERGRNGGKASGKARREKRDLREELKIALEIGDTQHELVTSIINKGKSGDVRAFNTIWEKTQKSQEQADRDERMNSDDVIYMRAYMFGADETDEDFQELKRRGRDDMCGELLGVYEKRRAEAWFQEATREWYKAIGEERKRLSRILITVANIQDGWDNQYYELFKKATKGDLNACDEVIRICEDVKAYHTKQL